jgi:hypothetical protein
VRGDYVSDARQCGVELGTRLQPFQRVQTRFEGFRVATHAVGKRDFAQRPRWERIERDADLTGTGEIECALAIGPRLRGPVVRGAGRSPPTSVPLIAGYAMAPHKSTARQYRLYVVESAPCR